VFLLLADHALDLLYGISPVYISFFNNWIKLEGIIVNRKGVKNFSLFAIGIYWNNGLRIVEKIEVYFS